MGTTTFVLAIIFGLVSMASDYYSIKSARKADKEKQKKEAQIDQNSYISRTGRHVGMLKGDY